MSKVEKTIELWDTDRIGNDIVYHYITKGMQDDDPAIKVRVTSDELCQFIEDYELNEFQTDVDDFKSYDSAACLVDAFEEVKDKYWLEILQPELETSYNEAIAFVQSYKAKRSQPLTDRQIEVMLKKVETNFGVHLTKEAA